MRGKKIKEDERVEVRVCDNSYHFSIWGMILAGFSAFIIGTILYFVSTSLGAGILCLSIAFMAGAALIAGATAMAKPESLIERAEIDWNEDYSKPVQSAEPLLKRVALAIVYKTIGKTVQQRRANYLVLFIGGGWILVCIAIHWSKK